MAETLVHNIDNAEAYEPVFGVDSEKIEDPVLFENAVQRIPRSLLAQDTLRLEEEMVDAQVGPDSATSFMQSHNERIDQFHGELSEMLDTVAPETIDRLALYLADGSEEAVVRIKEVLERRYARVEGVFVVDYLQRDMSAEFSDLTNTINASNTYSLLPERHRKKVLSEVILPHEILHTLSVPAKTKGLVVDKYGIPHTIPSRSGVSTVTTPKNASVDQFEKAHRHAEWLNEAFIEYVRTKIIDGGESGYRTGLAVVETMIELKPELEEVLKRVVFSGSNPAEAIGLIEATFGPLVVEEIGRIPKERDNEDGNKVYARKVAKLIGRGNELNTADIIYAHIRGHRPTFGIVTYLNLLDKGEWQRTERDFGKEKVA